jgi:heme exporter protein CcmD
MEPDLSDFYHHALSYGTYVTLAYGISLGVLGILSLTILSKRRRLQKKLNSLETS